MAAGRSALTILFVTVFTDLVGFGIIIPLLAIYALEWEASHLTVGLLFASYSLMQFLFAPLWGQLSDRIGRRPVILISLAGSTVSYVLFAWATVVQSIPLLFVSRILAGVMAANIPVAQAYIADVTPPDRRTAGMGLIGAAFGLGFVCGPALAGFLLLLMGEVGPGIGAAVICGANLLLAVFRLPESLPPEARHATERPHRFAMLADALSRRGVRGLLWLFFLFTLMWSIWETTLPAFCLARFDWREQEMAWVFTYAGIIMAFVQGFLVRRLRHRLTEETLIRTGSVLVTVGLLGLSVLMTGWLSLIALALFAFGIGFASPSLMGLVSQRVGADEQGRILGVNQALSSLARIVGPIVGYGLFAAGERLVAAPADQRWDEALPFIFAGALALTVLICALMIHRRAEV